MDLKNIKINPTKISLWLNIISFVIGGLFYLRMCSTPKQPEFVPDHSVKDTLLVVDTKLKEQLRELKIVQDSILMKLNEKKEELKQVEKETKVIRQHLRATVNNDWESLPQNVKDDYINKTMSNLKKQNKP